MSFEQWQLVPKINSSGETVLESKTKTGASFTSTILRARALQDGRFEFSVDQFREVIGKRGKTTYSSIVLSRTQADALIALLSTEVEDVTANGHSLFTKSDPDCPDQVKDRNGDVVLGMCKKCGAAEIELSSPCPSR